MNKKHIKVSLCMITLNEEKFIERALKNVKDYVDEIIIVDGGSKDKTVEIAKEFNAKIIFNKWEDNFAKQRNISLKHAIGDWIFVIDADEIQEKKLFDSLRKFANNDFGIDLFAFPRKNYIDGKQTSAYPDRQMRFFKNNKKIKYNGIVHEKPVGWKLLASPSDMHIIHRKTSQRQEKQNKLYDKIANKNKSK